MGSTRLVAKAFGLLLLPAMGTGLAGCQTACAYPDQRASNRVELFFGRDMQGGGQVSDADWAAFAARALTPAFPDGFTVLPAQGQWRDPASGRTSREATWVVEVVGDVPPADIARVTAAYRTEFRQRAVGVVSSLVCAAF